MAPTARRTAQHQLDDGDRNYREAVDGYKPERCGLVDADRDAGNAGLDHNPDGDKDCRDNNAESNIAFCKFFLFVCLSGDFSKDGESHIERDHCEQDRDYQLDYPDYYGD